jgi:hypothetical protein
MATSPSQVDVAGEPTVWQQELAIAETTTEPLWAQLTGVSSPGTPQAGRLEPAGASRPRRHHLLRYAVLGVVAVVLVGMGYIFLSYQFRAVPGAKSIHSAVDAFRGGKTTTNNKVHYEPPPQGVYELRGRGSETISFPPNSQSDGAVMPASVTYVAHGCWRWHLDYNVAHWEEYTFCPSTNQLAQTSNRNFQSWSFGTFKITNLANFTCPSNAVVLPDNPGASHTATWTCQGKNSAMKGKTVAQDSARVVGTTTLSLGNTQGLPAVREVQKTTLSGGQKGTVVETWWFSATSGLPLRVERQIKILTTSPIGTITYNESGSWQMASLTPRT